MRYGNRFKTEAIMMAAILPAMIAVGLLVCFGVEVWNYFHKA